MNITDEIKLHYELQDMERKLKLQINTNKIRIINFLKKRGWDNYTDENNKVKVELFIDNNVTLDKKMVKILMRPDNYVKAIKTTSEEKLKITTQVERKKIKETLKKKLNIKLGVKL